jgi:hypothetical protein
MNSKYLQKPEFSSVSPLMALLYRISLHDLTNLNFSVFFEVFLRVKKCSQPYDNYSEKTIILSGWPTNFSLRGCQSCYSMVCVKFLWHGGHAHIATMSLQVITFTKILFLIHVSKQCELVLSRPMTLFGDPYVDKHWFKPFKSERIPFPVLNLACHIKTGIWAGTVRE